MTFDNVLHKSFLLADIYSVPLNLKQDILNLKPIQDGSLRGCLQIGGVP